MAISDYPPYMNAYGVIPKILEKIKSAQTPERFTQDFLQTKLGFRGGNYRAFIPFAKRLGLIAGDGTPTPLYKAFRNPNQSGQAMASMMRHGYRELFSRNEYANDLDKSQLEGLLIEATGLAPGSSTLRSILYSWEGLKQYAKFDGEPDPADETNGNDNGETAEPIPAAVIAPSPNGHAQSLGLNLSYTINLVLPKTDDVAVFNAIFKSLREHLLTK